MDQISRRLALKLTFKKQDAYAIALTGIFITFAFLFAASRIFGNSLDYFEYDVFFDMARRENVNALFLSRFEPGFTIVAIFLTQLLTSNSIVYGWIVVATMLVKGWAIGVYSSSKQIFIIVAVFYFVRYFPLHELTQLRAACAIAFALWGAMAIWNGRFFAGFLICALAISFHISVIAVMPAFFLSPIKRWKVLFFALITFVLTTIFVGVVTNYAGNLIQIVSTYQANGFGDDKPNPFSVQLLIDWIMIAISLLIWDRLTLLMKRIVLLELVGMALFYGGVEFAIIAHRMREFYSVFWILFVADGLRYGLTRVLSLGFIFISIVFYMYIFFLSGTFFR